MSKILTKSQFRILRYLHKHVKLNGYPPSVREICLALKFKSTSTVHFHLTNLEKKGYIKKDPKKPRAITIVKPLIDNNLHLTK